SGWIGIAFLFHVCQSHNLLLTHAMVKKHEIPFFHGSKIIASQKISHPGPGRLSVLHECCPGISLGFLFYEPIVFRHSSPVLPISANSCNAMPSGFTRKTSL